MNYLYIPTSKFPVGITLDSQVMPQDIHKWKHWACGHAGEVGSQKKFNNYTCGHSVITCPKCERKGKEDCPLPGCCSNKNAPSVCALPVKKKSVAQNQSQPESSSDNLFYLILPPEVVMTIAT